MRNKKINGHVLALLPKKRSFIGLLFHGKRLLIIPLVPLVLTLMLSGCKNRPTTSSVIQLHLMAWGVPDEMVVLKEMIPVFESKHPNIKVKVEYGGANIIEKIMTEMAAGTPPDVMWMYDSALPGFANRGSLLVLDKFAKEDKTLDINDFYPMGLRYGTVENRLYLFPRTTGTMLVFYNKDLFDKYNVPYPQENWTWDDLLDKASKLTKDTNNDGRNDIWGIMGIDNVHVWPNFINQNGGAFLSQDRKECLIDRKEAIEALIFIKDIFQKYNVAIKLGSTGSSTGGFAGMNEGQIFATGKIAMMYSSGGGPLKDIKNINWDVVEVPMRKKKAAHGGTLGYAIAARTKYPKESWELLKFLVSRDVLKKNFPWEGGLPSRKSLQNDYFNTILGPGKNYKAFITSMENAIYEMQFEKFSEVSGSMDKLINYAEGTLKGDMKTECIRIKKEIDKILKS